MIYGDDHAVARNAVADIRRRDEVRGRLLDPAARGVGVIIEAEHQCLMTRGVHKHGINMTTSRMLGAFRANPDTAANCWR